MKSVREISSVLAAAALAVGVVAYQASAQTGTAASPTASPSSSPSAGASAGPSAALATEIENVGALNYMHHVDILESQAAAGAQTKVTSPSATAFLTSAQSGYQGNETQVVALANSKGVTLEPFQAATYEVAENSILSTLTGAQFEEAFLALQTFSHQEILSNLNLLKAAVTDADVKNQINSTITVVQNQLTLLGSAGGSASPTPSPSASAGAGAAGSAGGMTGSGGY